MSNSKKWGEVSHLAKTTPFHSKLPGTTVYHNNTLCTEGDNIEWYNKVPGTGGLKLCHHCAKLN